MKVKTKRKKDLAIPLSLSSSCVFTSHEKRVDGGVRDAFPILPLPSFLLPPVAVRWLGMDGKEVKGKERDRLPAFFFHQNPFIISLFLMSLALKESLFARNQGRKGNVEEKNGPISVQLQSVLVYRLFLSLVAPTCVWSYQRLGKELT